MVAKKGDMILLRKIIIVARTLHQQRTLPAGSVELSEPHLRREFFN
jgi:hypothetical protein